MRTIDTEKLEALEGMAQEAVEIKKREARYYNNSIKELKEMNSYKFNKDKVIFIFIIIIIFVLTFLCVYFLVDLEKMPSFYLPTMILFYSFLLMFLFYRVYVR